MDRRTFLAGSLACAPMQAGLMTSRLAPKTTEAFNAYVKQREARMEEIRIRQGKFLWADDDSARRGRLAASGFVIEGHNPGPLVEVPDGLIHDWAGAVFLPGAGLDKTLAFLQDYNSHKNHFAPEVADSRLLSRDGNRFRAYLRLRKHRIITVILNSEYDVTYWKPASGKAMGRSYSTRIAEVQDAGTAKEKELPPGDDHGFLWRLYTYWRLLERDGGVYVECEAISLSRDVPFGLGTVIRPIIRELPRESLERTLLGTRQALGKR